MVLNPRHRGDCADFFVATHQTHRVQLDGPADVIGEIEHAAALAGRTWNTQLTYVLELCLGYHPSDFDDGRSVEDWRTLLRPCRFRLSEAKDWSPFTCLSRKTARVATMKERESC
jgi:hypothetical protein